MTDAALPPPPPDSWPGAGGRRSVAPEVSTWPGTPRVIAGGASPADAPGGTWPGAAPSSSAPASSTPTSVEMDDDFDSGGVAAVLFPAVSLLVALSLVALWAWLDHAHRAAQVVVLVVLLVVASGSLLLSLARHRSWP